MHRLHKVHTTLHAKVIMHCSQNICLWGLYRDIINNSIVLHRRDRNGGKICAFSTLWQDEHKVRWFLQLLLQGTRPVWFLFHSNVCESHVFHMHIILCEETAGIYTRPGIIRWHAHSVEGSNERPGFNKHCSSLHCEADVRQRKVPIYRPLLLPVVLLPRVRIPIITC